VRKNTVTTQFTTHTKVLAASVATKCMKHRNLLEPTIGLEPMTCRLRIVLPEIPQGIHAFANES